MDPLSITTAVLSITKKCCSTASVLHEIRTKYKDAPTTITSICSQTTVISASLSHLQYLILKREDLSTVLERRPELASALDCSLIGCVMLFACLDDEVERVTRVASTPSFNWRGKARIMWNQETLRNMLEDLRSQQAALSTLINLFQTDSVAELKSLLDRNKSTFETTQRRTSTLRKSNPNVKVRKSIYSEEDEGPVDAYSLAPSSLGVPSSPNQPSECQFDFNHLVKNSRVYKKALAHQNSPPAESTIEGDLIDLSDEPTPEEELFENSQDGAFQQLQELVDLDDTEDSPQDDSHTPVARSPPKLELPEDFSRSLDLRRTSPPSEHDPSLEMSPRAADEATAVDDECEDDLVATEMTTISDERGSRPFSKFDSVIFKAPIPRADRSESNLGEESMSAGRTPHASIDLQREPVPGPSTGTRYNLHSPEPDIRDIQPSPTPSTSNYSSSSRLDNRRHTSSLEVDYSDKPVSPVRYMRDSFSPQPRPSLQRNASPLDIDMRSQQVSPAPSIDPPPSYYPRPEIYRSPSSLESNISHDSSSSAQTPAAKKTLRTRFWRQPSSTRYCYRCKGLITGKHLSTMGVNFHNECFRCADCDKMLRDTAFPYKHEREDGGTETVPLCEMDYFRRLDPVCRQCGMALCGSYVAAFRENRKKVPEAFACEGCTRVLKSPFTYYQTGGRVYC